MEEQVTQAKMIGWQRQGTFDEPRLSELTQMYKEIGFEVRLLPASLEKSEDCTTCVEADPGRYKVIYTRRQK